MKLVAAGYGSRGDITPNAAVARELLRRGHEVRMAVPPNLVGFVEAAGLEAVAYGPDMQAKMEELRTCGCKFPQPQEDPGSDQVAA